MGGGKYKEEEPQEKRRDIKSRKKHVYRKGCRKGNGREYKDGITNGKSKERGSVLCLR